MRKVTFPFKGTLKTSDLNQRFADLASGSILQGFRLKKGTGFYSVSIARDGAAESILLTKNGVRLVDEGDAIDAIRISPNTSTQDRYDVVYVIHDPYDATFYYEAVEGISGESVKLIQNPELRTAIGHVRVRPNQTLTQADLTAYPLGLRIGTSLFEKVADFIEGIKTKTLEIDGKKAASEEFATSQATSKANTALTDAKAYADAQLNAAKTYTSTQLNALIGGAPGTLDTLKEIADALGNDAQLSSKVIETRTEVMNARGTFASLKERMDLQKYYVNVKEFGAKGDGVTDDTAAIQAALNSGATVRVPIGTYVVTNTLIMPTFSSLLLEGVATEYTVPKDKVAILKISSNKHGISMDTGCEIIGGRIETVLTDFSSALVFVDYSTRRLSNMTINTTLRGSKSIDSKGILFDGNGNGGSLYQISIEGRIHEFDYGVKTNKTTGDSWATGGTINAKITNCIQALNANTVFGGGKISGSMQPLLKGGAFADTERSLVYMESVGNCIFEAMLWDLSQAINKTGLELNKCEYVEYPSIIDPIYIKNNSVKNTRKLNPIIAPRQATTYFDSMSGNEENVLFGSHEKYTVAINSSANVSIVSNNASYERFGMFKLAGKPMYAVLNTVADEWMSIQIDFDTPKNISLLGFVPKSEPVLRPKSFKIYTKRDVDSDFVLRKEGNTSDLIFSAGNISETAIHAIIPFDQRSNVISIKFDFLLEQNRALILEALFAKGNGMSDAYIPGHGGKAYGDIEFVKGGVILKSPNGLIKKRIGIDNSGNIILTTI